MKIIYKHGDLMQASEDALMHGCNAQGVMGSGVAKLIRDAYPGAYTAYRDVFKAVGLKLGDLIGADRDAYGYRHSVINAITQQFYGRDPDMVYVSYTGLRKAMSAVPQLMHLLGPDRVLAMPLIGAGLANGKWSIISKIIEDESDDWQPVVYLQDGIIPDGVVGSVEKAEQ